jgi:hypothetical protein
LTKNIQKTLEGPENPEWFILTDLAVLGPYWEGEAFQFAHTLTVPYQIKHISEA